MGFLLKILSIPTVGKLALKIMKKRAFKPYQIPLEKALEKQYRMLKVKFKRMEGTEIGKKLGIYERKKIQDLQITDYSFYEPFYKNPSPSAFMYPLKNYVRLKTSGTAGKEKWFLFPRGPMVKAFRETIPQAALAIFHDGEKITLEYGDNVFVNIGPSPFGSSTVVSLGSKKIPIFNFVPNLNLSYKEKVRYFILNHEKIDGAFMMGSTLISQIMPAIRKPIKLKGFMTYDTPEIEIYREEIEKFINTIPKTFYASTETLGACSVTSVQHSMGFLFDWRRGFFEFLPLKEGEVKKEPVTIDKVTVGGIYQLIFTGLDYEIIRFNTMDSFKCIAKGDDIMGTDFPIFRYQGRLDKVISLQNFTRITEEELIMAFKKSRVPFMDFTTKTRSEKGLEFIAIYVEHTGDMAPEEIKDAIHKQLCTMDSDYRDLSDFLEYTPVEIHLVPKGVFAEYLERKGVLGVSKVDRIDMREKDFKLLTQVINSKKFT